MYGTSEKVYYSHKVGESQDGHWGACDTCHLHVDCYTTSGRFLNDQSQLPGSSSVTTFSKSYWRMSITPTTRIAGQWSHVNHYKHENLKFTMVVELPIIPLCHQSDAISRC